MVAVSTSERRILRGGGVVEELAVARAVSEHPCEGVKRGVKMLCFLFLCLTFSPSSSISSLPSASASTSALCLDDRLSPPPSASTSVSPVRATLFRRTAPKSPGGAPEAPP